MTTAEQLALTATEALRAMNSGRLSAEAYVTTLLTRAEALKDLNCFITVDRDGALTAARSVDTQRRTGIPLPPLAGLPIVVKDNINTRSLPTTGGTAALRALQPSDNAPSLQKLIDAGAIVLGKTNLHELAAGITSTNLTTFAGPVRNPYDTARIPGGSSGGTAAAIAARIAPAGLGTDTAGSSRIPAALCGIAGMRPSVGNGGVQRRYTDTNAVVPLSHTRDTVGPMARSVADLALLDAAIVGRSVPNPVGLKGLRVGVPTSFWAGLDTQVASVAGAAREELAKQGVVFVDVDLAGLATLNERVSSPLILHEAVGDIPAYLAANGAAGVTLASLAAGVASPDVRDAFLAILGDAFGGPPYEDAVAVHRPAMQALYARYFSENAVDAVMFPTTPLPAVLIDGVRGSSTVSINGGALMDEFSAYVRNTDPSSSAGLPGLSLFAGMTSDGLPVGLELDGPLGSDQLLLGIGMSVEAVLGFAPAPGL
ncbi:indoleacetamide hydrolase [Acidovorax sp. DW039]|uniref:indoleacetamide hydrolase n=1 Tax=Acidovorax sp. DW039 TaxID=3095606 RepID=UPI0030D12A22